jgi:hypothetical protein
MPALGSPTPHELRAALHVARMLPDTGLSPAAARASYALVPTGGLYRREDFVAAERRLANCGLIVSSQGLLSPSPELIEAAHLPEAEAIETLLLAIMERDPPVWLSAPPDAIRDNIPDRDWATFENLIADPTRREALLLALSSKIDTAKSTMVGMAGEVSVVESCRHRLVELGRPDLAACVRRVSIVSDQLGYDVVTPTLAGPVWRLEIKTTQVLGFVIVVHLTRNEARVGLSDPRWALVVCWQHSNDSIQIIGWCSASQLAPLLPTDVCPEGAWTSARLVLLRDDLNDGLPDLNSGAVP